jgi:SLT domain-containing protein
MRLRTVFAGLALVLAGSPALAQPAPPVQAERVDIAAHVTEAAQRFGIPEDWIYAVMRVESAGRTGAVSAAGAMGLMQLMPATWTRQRARFGLGNDPFDPRDNIIAGTSYLREMYDRYGAPGFLAAYNAGPGRYEDWRDRSRALPVETVNYVARIAPRLQSGGTARAPLAAASRPMEVKPAPGLNRGSTVIPWTQATLFVARSESPTSDSSASIDPTTGSPNPVQNSDRSELFAPVSAAFRP